MLVKAQITMFVKKLFVLYFLIRLLLYQSSVKKSSYDCTVATQLIFLINISSSITHTFI